MLAEKSKSDRAWIPSWATQRVDVILCVPSCPLSFQLLLPQPQRTRRYTKQATARPQPTERLQRDQKFAADFADFRV